MKKIEFFLSPQKKILPKKMLNQRPTNSNYFKNIKEFPRFMKELVIFWVVI